MLLLMIEFLVRSIIHPNKLKMIASPLFYFDLINLVPYFIYLVAFSNSHVQAMMTLKRVNFKFCFNLLNILYGQLWQNILQYWFQFSNLIFPAVTTTIILLTSFFVSVNTWKTVSTLVNMITLLYHHSSWAVLSTLRYFLVSSQFFHKVVYIGGLSLKF